MHAAEAKEIVERYLSSRFGSLLRARDPRSANGGAFDVPIVSRCSDGRLAIATLTVESSGRISPELTPIEVVDAIRAATVDRLDERHEPRFPSAPPAGIETPLPGSFRAFSPAPKPPAPSVGTSSIDFSLGELDIEVPPESAHDLDLVREQVQDLVARGDRDSLERARSLAPRLLADAERHGVTLMKMAEIERRLGDSSQALRYLAAAAQDFGDRFKMGALERCAATALAIAGREAFASSPVSSLLNSCRQRLRPLHDVLDAPALAALRPDERKVVRANVQHRVLTPGEVVLQAGTPSRAIWIVKSGLLAVIIPTPQGESRWVRCCHPGWLLGENSVLGTGEALASATLRADGVAEVFSVDAEIFKGLMAKNDLLRDRIAATKHVHRMDSFLTLHPTLGTLELSVRDALLGCVRSVDAFEGDQELVHEGQVPDSAWAVVRGEVTIETGLRSSSSLRTKEVFGFRDTIHQVASAYTATAKAGTTLAAFDGVKLRAFAQGADEAALAAIERLG